MTNVQLYTTQAIQAAGNGNWEVARELNEKILEIEQQNIGALNRLGFCYMQLESLRKAKETYEQVLKLERFNPIASKYAALLKSKIKPAIPASQFTGDFIEEPGKTRSIALTKLADPAVLQGVPTATICHFVVKNHRVNVVTEATNTYLGCLPDDIAFRLQKMIAAGTTYTIHVQSTSKKTCIVFIKEVHREASSPFATSFPIQTLRSSHQEDVVLDEAPLDVRETGDELEARDFDETDPTE